MSDEIHGWHRAGQGHWQRHGDGFSASVRNLAPGACFAELVTESGRVFRARGTGLLVLMEQVDKAAAKLGGGDDC